MASKRIVEVFGAGCPICTETVEFIRRIACSSCEVSVLDMRDATVAERAKELGIRSIPAVTVDGVVVECCAGRGPDEASLRAAGVGQTKCI